MHKTVARLASGTQKAWLLGEEENHLTCLLPKSCQRVEINIQDLLCSPSVRDGSIPGRKPPYMTLGRRS